MTKTIENTQQESTEHTPGLRNEIELRTADEVFRYEKELSLDRLVSALIANNASTKIRFWGTSGEEEAEEESRLARLEAAHATYALNSASNVRRISEGAWLFR